MASDSAPLLLLSQVLGWVYFVAWSISFYPQVILNYQRQSVCGLSFEFLAFHLSGFFFYSIFTVANYVEQKRLHLEISVEPSDVAFAVHALVLTALTSWQCFIYERGNQRFRMEHAILLGAIWLLFGYNFILCFTGVLRWIKKNDGDEFSFAEFLGYSKAFISVIKLVPQVVFNYRSKAR